MEFAPTGQQHELRSGQHVAVAVELGGGLRRYTLDGRDVVDGFAEDALPDAGRGQLLAPWPNRIRDGQYHWDGKDLQLAINEPRLRNAIHGLVRWLPFTVQTRNESAITLGTTLWAHPGYPHRLDFEVDYRLGVDGLTVAITAHNTGSSVAPYAVGQHPYVTVGTALIDDTVLTIPAETWLRTDERATPVADVAVAGSPYDFRQPRRVGNTKIDTAFGNLHRDGSECAVVRLANPDDGFAVDVWVDGSADFLQVYTADGVSDPARRRGSLAVEPMSAPANAFRSDRGVVTLPPGGTHRLSWGIVPRPTTDTAAGRTGGE